MSNTLVNVVVLKVSYSRSIRVSSKNSVRLNFCENRYKNYVKECWGNMLIFFISMNKLIKL
jgi:hypothetical protein